MDFPQIQGCTDRIQSELARLADEWLRQHWDHSPYGPVGLMWRDDAWRREYRCRCGRSLFLRVTVVQDERGVVFRIVPRQYTHS